MELNKEQIEHIDYVLEKKGIQYWDLRIEMIDHIVSDIENHATSDNFKKEFENALIRVKWNKSLLSENKVGWKNVNKRYRNLFKKELLNFFLSTRKSLLIIAFFIIYYTLSQNLTFAIFSKISYIIFILPMLIVLVSSIWLLFKRFGKSVHINYGLFYFSFSFLMINSVIHFMRYTSDANQQIIWLITLPIYLAAMYAGFIVFTTAIKKVTQIKKELAL
jgi:hypothetical protein